MKQQSQLLSTQILDRNERHNYHYVRGKQKGI